ncbi:hypothetical protein JCGZ_18095 [Jatropha curcas]|uniref:Nuclease associated modular domain-containing protein n=1 Tax=Jatropha curcas TaxID=180498 RepID=A0A067K2R4_JATCU|nr:hypothetical protein JCGZ_18095 [Jatropha curcas]
MVHSNYYTSVLQSVCPLYASFNFFPKTSPFCSLAFTVDVEQESGFGKHFQLKLGQDLAETLSSKEDSLLDSCQDSSRSPSDQKKMKTKRKRKHGNKGRVPWNKGRKHTAVQ